MRIALFINKKIIKFPIAVSCYRQRAEKWKAVF